MTIHASIDVGRTLATEAKMRQRDAADLYGNDSAYERGCCLQSYELGQAAFWSSAGYSSQLAGCLLNKLNGGQPKGYLVDAVREIYGGRDLIEALSYVIPLNTRAAEDLSGAYSAFGLWRDADELAMRLYRKGHRE